MDGDLCLLAHPGDFLGQLLAALLQAGKELKDLLLVGSDGGSRLGISAHVQILFHGHMQEDMTAFRHLCQTGLDDFMSADALDALALVEDVAGLRVEQAGDGLQGGGLTGTVLAHQGHDLAGAELQLRVVQRFHAGEGLYHAFHYQTVF